jgi:hypothetical protein
MAKPERDGDYIGEIVPDGHKSWIWMGSGWEENRPEAEPPPPPPE